MGKYQCFIGLFFLLTSGLCLATPLLRYNVFGYIDQPLERNIQKNLIGGYRAYNPTDGQFLTADSLSPFSNARTFNGYNYAQGNPLLMDDPSGHTSQMIPPVWAGIISAVVSGLPILPLTDGLLRLGMRPIFAAFLTSGALSGALGGISYQLFARQSHPITALNLFASAGIGIAATLPISAILPFIYYRFDNTGNIAIQAGRTKLVQYQRPHNFFIADAKRAEAALSVYDTMDSSILISNNADKQFIKNLTNLRSMPNQGGLSESWSAMEQDIINLGKGYAKQLLKKHQVTYIPRRPLPTIEE